MQTSINKDAAMRHCGTHHSNTQSNVHHGELAGEVGEECEDDDLVSTCHGHKEKEKCHHSKEQICQTWVPNKTGILSSPR